MNQTKTVSHWNGPEQSKEEVIQHLKATPVLYRHYSQRNGEVQNNR